MKTWLISILAALAFAGCEASLTVEQKAKEQDAEVERLAKLPPAVAVFVALREELGFLIIWVGLAWLWKSNDGGKDE